VSDRNLESCGLVFVPRSDYTLGLDGCRERFECCVRMGQIIIGNGCTLGEIKS